MVYDLDNEVMATSNLIKASVNLNITYVLITKTRTIAKATRFTQPMLLTLVNGVMIMKNKELITLLNISLMDDEVELVTVVAAVGEAIILVALLCDFGEPPLFDAAESKDDFDGTSHGEN